MQCTRLTRGPTHFRCQLESVAAERRNDEKTTAALNKQYNRIYHLVLGGALTLKKMGPTAADAAAEKFTWSPATAQDQVLCLSAPSPGVPQVNGVHNGPATV